MSLKVLEKEDFEELPERFHADYDEGEDGKFYLKEVKDLVPPKDQDKYEELMGALQKQRNDTKAEAQKRRELETRLETLGGLEEFEALRQQREEAERKNLEKKGEYDKLLEQVKSQKDAEIDKWKGRYEKILSRYDLATRGREVMEAIAKHGGNPNLLQPILMQKTKLVGDVEAGEDLRVEILDNDSALVDGDGNLLSVEGYVKRLRGDDSYAGAFKGTGNTGGGGGGESNPPREGEGRSGGGGMPPDLANLRRSQMTPRQKIDVQNALAEQHGGNRDAALSAYLQIPD